MKYPLFLKRIIFLFLTITLIFAFIPKAPETFAEAKKCTTENLPKSPYADIPKAELNKVNTFYKHIYDPTDNKLSGGLYKYTIEDRMRVHKITYYIRWKFSTYVEVQNDERTFKASPRITVERTGTITLNTNTCKYEKNTDKSNSMNIINPSISVNLEKVMEPSSSKLDIFYRFTSKTEQLKSSKNDFMSLGAPLKYVLNYYGYGTIYDIILDAYNFYKAGKDVFKKQYPFLVSDALYDRKISLQECDQRLNSIELQKECKDRTNKQVLRSLNYTLLYDEDANNRLDNADEAIILDCEGTYAQDKPFVRGKRKIEFLFTFKVQQGDRNPPSAKIIQERIIEKYTLN